jgi:hypothetical protein
VDQQNLIFSAGARRCHRQMALPLERADGFHHRIEPFRTLGMFGVRFVPAHGRIVKHVGSRSLCGNGEGPTAKRQQRAARL